MELRPPTPAEMDEYSRAALRAFHRELSDDDRTRYRRVDEPERSLAWFDDGRIVATTGAFTRTITVPGGAVPCAGVTAVAVVPTHRRRGLLTAMMRRQLDDLRRRGDPVAALWASEGRIYGRFGYGIAARAVTLLARRPEARVALAPSDGAPLRAGPAGEHTAAMRAVYEHVRPQRPGLLDRPGPWWDDRLHDPESDRHGAQPLQAAIVEDGYALYAVRPGEEADSGPAGEVVVREVVAATPAAHARLWAFLLDQDLTRTISWEIAPADEPLWLALTDPTAVRLIVHDGLWLRLVDVGAALAGRRYAGDHDVVIEVADGFCQWNAGRYRLSGERTDAAADVALDVAALASAYLGGTTFHELAAAGRARELTPGAVARAAAAFRADVAPWCPETF
jgi:predicted acetyltransferase